MRPTCSVRLDEAELARIEFAASLSGEPKSAFIRRAALDRAADVIRDEWMASSLEGDSDHRSADRSPEAADGAR